MELLGFLRGCAQSSCTLAGLAQSERIPSRRRCLRAPPSLGPSLPGGSPSLPPPPRHRPDYISRRAAPARKSSKANKRAAGCADSRQGRKKKRRCEGRTDGRTGPAPLRLAAEATSAPAGRPGVKEGAMAGEASPGGAQVAPPPRRSGLRSFGNLPAAGWGEEAPRCKPNAEERLNPEMRVEGGRRGWREGDRETDRQTGRYSERRRNSSLARLARSVRPPDPCPATSFPRGPRSCPKGGLGHPTPPHASSPWGSRASTAGRPCWALSGVGLSGLCAMVKPPATPAATSPETRVLLSWGDLKGATINLPGGTGSTCPPTPGHEWEPAPNPPPPSSFTWRQNWSSLWDPPVMNLAFASGLLWEGGIVAWPWV